MKPQWHTAATVTISSAIYAAYHSIPAFVSSMLGGIMIDIDHIMDYYMHRGTEFRISRFFDWCYKNKWDRLILVFHSIELVFVLWGVVSFFHLSIFWIALAAGISQHMVLDIIFNSRTMPVRSYFFIYRCARGFRKEYLGRRGYGDGSYHT